MFDEAQTPFPLGAYISSNSVDAYLTFMDESTLRSFAADAEARISFEKSHITRQPWIGQSIGGRYVEQQDLKRTVSEVYTVPGFRLNDVSTFDFIIIGARSSLISDVSVGFYGGVRRCMICSRELSDWDCEHVHSRKYEVASDEKVIREMWTIARIEGAHLTEVSAVYDGATRDTAVLKSQESARRVRIRTEVIPIAESSLIKTL